MKPGTDIIAWGRHGTDDFPMVPAELRYHAIVKHERWKDCGGCMFKGQRIAVCHEAARVAIRAGLVDCDTVDKETGRTHVYQRIKFDVRQVDLVDEQRPVAVESGP